MIKLHELSKEFHEKKVLDAINYTFEPGKIYGIVAPNGMGKSTLFELIMNFQKPSNGYVLINGLKQESSNKQKVYQMITMMPDQNDLYPFLTGRDHLTLFRDMWSETAIDPQLIIEKLKMEKFIDKKTELYSMGMKQTLCFGLVLTANTDIMLLDEAMNGLDPDNVSLISSLISDLPKSGKTVLLISHLLDNLESLSDFILFLKDGKIIHQWDKQTKKNNVIKFFTEHSELPDNLSNTPELLQDLKPNHYFFESSDSINDIQNLIHSGITQIELTHLSIQDLYSQYFN